MLSSVTAQRQQIMVLLPSLCHPDTQHAESSRNTSNWYASWITDKRSSMMSFVCMGVLVLSTFSWYAFVSGSVVISSVSMHKAVCVSVKACGVWKCMILSGCRFVLENSMSNFVSLCVCANVCVFVRVNWCLCYSRVRVRRLMDVCVCVGKCVWCLVYIGNDRCNSCVML